MPRGKWWPLEERLRMFVASRIKTRGDAARIAKAIGQDDDFISRYPKGERHANLDTTVAIAKYYTFSLSELTGLAPLPTREEDWELLRELWSRATPGMRRAALILLGLEETAVDVPRSVIRGSRQPRASAPTMRARKSHGTKRDAP